METIRIDLKNITVESMDIILDNFNRGKTIVYPTDTVYGIGCNCFDEEAAKRIYKLKKREKRKQFLILVSSMNMAKRYAEITKTQEKVLKNFWPGPVTVILNAKKNLPEYLVSNDKSIAIRFPNDDFLQRLIKKLDYPIISTSLNISGQEELDDMNKIVSYFKDKKPDLVIDAGRIKEKKPSTIIDLRDVKNIEIIRK